MRQRYKRSGPIILSVVLSVIALFLFVFPHFEHEKIIVAPPALNATFFDTAYKRQADSLANLQYYREGVVYDGLISPIGVLQRRAFLDEREVQNGFYHSLQKETSAKIDSICFFTFNGLTFKSFGESEANASVYFIKNRHGYLANGNTITHSELFYDEDVDSVMLPVAEHTYQILKYLLIFLMIALILLLVIISSGGIIRLIMEIRKGNIFTSINLLILRTLMYVFLSVPAIYCLIHLACFLVLNKLYRGIIIKPEIFYNTGKLLFIGFVFGALYQAFKKGYSIQQENEFTV